MGRILGYLLLAAAILGILGACAPTAPAPTASPTKAPAAPAAAPTTAAVPTKPPEPPPTVAPTPTPPPKPVTIKYGGTQTIGEAGVFVALERGYFREQAITLELVNFRSGNEVVAPLSTGQLDVGSLTLGVPILAAADRGVEMKIVAGGGQLMPKWEGSTFVLRKDLADSGRVKTPADLKGMKVAAGSPGSLGEMMVQTMLEQAGLKPGDVELVVLPFAEQAAAFANKAIAAAYSVEPFIARGIQEGFSVRWVNSSQYFGGKVQTLSMVIGPTLAKDQDLARRWLLAYIKGARDYVRAFSTGEGRREIIDILIRNTPITDPKLYDVMEMSYLDPNGQLDRKSMDAQYKYLVEKGHYAGKKKFDDIMDMSHLEYALQKLGKQ